jgi:hypothetical protein
MFRWPSSGSSWVLASPTALRTSAGWPGSGLGGPQYGCHQGFDLVGTEPFGCHEPCVGEVLSGIGDVETVRHGESTSEV